ncbi:MAG: hypothetical protein L3J54_14605 [Draconibacterium sp.]|nr:hypothetical protein [Draconibacterium sp.]
MKKSISLLFAAIFILSFQTTKSQNMYKDSGQPISKRVNNLLSEMTLEEKVAQLMMSKNIMWDENGDIKTSESKPISFPFSAGWRKVVISSGVVRLFNSEK